MTSFIVHGIGCMGAGILLSCVCVQSASAQSAPAGGDPDHFYLQALAAYDQGRFDEAERLHRRALALHRDRLPAGHPLIATALTNLGVLSRIRGDLKQAEALLNDSLSRQPRPTPDRAAALIALANVHSARRKPFMAEPLVREAVAILEGFDAPDPRALPAALSSLGALHLELDDPEGAERQFRRAIDLAGDAPLAFRSTLQSNLAAALFAEGRTAESLMLYSKTLSQTESALGSAHPRTTGVRRNYADALAKTGRKAEAREVLRGFVQ